MPSWARAADQRGRPTSTRGTSSARPGPERSATIQKRTVAAAELASGLVEPGPHAELPLLLEVLVRDHIVVLHHLARCSAKCGEEGRAWLWAWGRKRLPGGLRSGQTGLLDGAQPSGGRTFSLARRAPNAGRGRSKRMLEHLEGRALRRLASRRRRRACCHHAANSSRS